MEMLLSNEFTEYQLYPEIDDADWQILNFSAKSAVGRVFCDLLLASRSTGKVIPVMMNELLIRGGHLSEIRLSTMLNKLPESRRIMLATVSLNLVEEIRRASVQLSMVPLNIVQTALVKEFQAFAAVSSSHRRPTLATTDYNTAIRGLRRYQFAASIIKKCFQGHVRILDCSCGSGYGSVILSRVDGAMVTGADIDAEAIDISARLIRGSNTNFVHTSLDTFAKSNHDVVVNFETMEHTHDDNMFLLSALDALTEDGLLLLSVPSWRWHGIHLNSDHRINYTYEKIEKLFAKHFEKFQIHGIEHQPLNPFLYKVTPPQEITDKKLIEEFIVSARKRDLKSRHIAKQPDKLRILFVSHSIPPFEWTGVPISALGLAKAVRDLGHEIAILIASDKSSGLPPEYIDGIPVYKAPRLSHEKTFFGDPYAGLGDYLSLVEDVLDDFRPDVVDVQDYVFMSPAILQLFKDKGCVVGRKISNLEELCFRVSPYIEKFDRLCSGPDNAEKCAVCHSLDSSESNTFFTIRKQSEVIGKIFNHQEYIRYLYKNVIDFVIFSGENIKQYMDSFLNYKAGYVIPIGIDATERSLRTRPSSQILTFAYLGVVTKHKGIHHLIEAFSHPDILQHDVRLNIHGSIHDKAMYGMIRNLEEQTSGKIKYFGKYSPEQIAGLLADVDVGIVPSCFETYCRTARELLIHGVPVIGTRAFGIPEVVSDGINGFLFDVGDVAQLTKILRSVITNRNILDDIQRGARQTSIPSRADSARQVVEVYRAHLSHAD